MKLNLGAGDTPLDGYINLDIQTADSLFPLYQHGVNDSAFDDETCLEVRASHVLEHFPMAYTVEVLREWVRVLKPGGILKIAVPDFRKIAAAYLSPSDKNEAWNIAGYAMGGQTDEHDFHKAIFDEEGLTEAFAALGLVDITHWTSEIEDCASLPVSLNLQGRKPAQGEQVRQEPATGRIPRGTVNAVMSMPRLAFTSNMFCGFNALVPHGINIRNSTSAFWGQGLSECFRGVMEQETPPKYILTIDYDTIFTAEDVWRLYALMESNAHVDAVCPLQMKRGCESPLFRLTGGTAAGGMVNIPRADLEQDLIELQSGHFGLTLLRVAALTEVEKPYFLHAPDAEGEWGDGRVDEDIYFWQNWRRSGKTLYLAPTVNVGHIEMVCLWADENEMKTIYQNVGDFNKVGKPAGIWGR